MDRVMAATVFNHICDLGSLSAAARALGLSRPMVSRYLDEMEKWAGARLIHRSSRRLTITPAGEEALLKTRSLAQLSLDIGAASGAQIPSGTLRVACAHFTAMHILAPVLPAFMEQYPQLRIEVEINNQPVSLVGERIDVAIRITDNPEPGTIARRLGDCKSVLCASADYLHQHGTPETVDDLTRHNCLYYSGFAGQSWHFFGCPGAVCLGCNQREFECRDLFAALRVGGGRNGDRVGARGGGAGRAGAGSVNSITARTST
ncbi:LysR-family transcriptional regulator clustered with PA0057 [Citrobacter freundii]|uniref:LysR-family transcriptional regulator clustered with PA0057 n=1 Tax=Citrobacter freundii TaxID=546 RepID=A0A7G2IUE3_CITFR|nr:LysR-family transcriptional regulator clustered with PA0057 [Citrobacter freundii]